MEPIITIVQQAEATEEQLIQQIKSTETQAAWTTGEMISQLKAEFSLTDEQIASRTDLSRETITQRRSVWETFADCKSIYKLSWSHFLAAVSWDAAAECLQWADENKASVSQMKAWRRSQHGEDLTTPADEDEPSLSVKPSFPVEPREQAPAERSTPETVETTTPQEPAAALSHSPKEEPEQPHEKAEPTDQLERAIRDCVNIHEAVLAVRKLSKAAVEMYDSDQLVEFADELRSCLRVIETRTHV